MKILLDLPDNYVAALAAVCKQRGETRTGAIRRILFEALTPDAAKPAQVKKTAKAPEPEPAFTQAVAITRGTVVKRR